MSTNDICYAFVLPSWRNSHGSTYSSPKIPYDNEHLGCFLPSSVPIGASFPEEQPFYRNSMLGY